MSEIKMVSISGGAALDLTGGRQKKGRRNTKKNQSGGGDELVRGVSQVITAVKGIEAPSLASTAASPNSNTWLKYPSGAPEPPKVNFSPSPSTIPSSPNDVAAPTSQYTQQGGTKHVRVELKKKPATKKVHLNPKGADMHKSQLAKKHMTKKSRKVSIGIKSLHKRLTRAKKLHKEVKEMPIEKLKDKLIKSGLIKSTSKAPESIIRQIARDAEVVKNKAL